MIVYNLGHSIPSEHNQIQQSIECNLKPRLLDLVYAHILGTEKYAVTE